MANDDEHSRLIRSETLADLEPSAETELLRFAAAEDRPPPNGRRIFVNRAVRLETIRHVGFDLDWTLADYHQEETFALAFRLALDRLVADGYPEAIRGAEFRPRFARRGLMIDTAEGMVLKMNRHRYVGRAYHGRDFLPAEERSRLYRREPLNLASDRFYFVDTLFELPEVNLFSELVALSKRRSGLGLPAYGQLYRDVRGAVDAIHADETLKRRILADPERFLPREAQLALALVRLRLGGRRLLLITNSEHYYTEGLCSYLFDGALPGLGSWRELFDLVIVDAAKPGFFRRSRPFVRLDEAGRRGEEVAVPEWGGLYSGGCREGLMQLLDGPGERVLYVGDHIYGDILSPKLATTWRTALVIRELEEELAVQRQLSSYLRHADVLRSEIGELGQRMDDVTDVQLLYRELVGNGSPLHDDPTYRRLERQLGELRREHRAMRQHKNRLQERISRAINPYWGSMFKQGSNKSLFGAQVDDYACLYTSRLSNFASYGTHHYFRVLRDPMMHEDGL
jgi:HAD superfamily 5'-nucleotidase-like hydrolase